MSKTFLLPNTRQYKANLHCHTTLSDGKLTPEQIKQAYRRHGYSVVAYTDHEYIVNHQDLNDDSFIAITAYEMSINRVPSKDGRQRWLDNPCCHLNFYAKDPYQDKHVCFKPEHVWGPGKAIAHTLKYVGEPYDKNYDDLQYVIDQANASGYLVCLNHPYWSLQPQADYFGLNGLFAMEVYNTGCGMLSGHSWYDYGLLCDTKNDLAPIAADDNHNGSGDVENSDSFGGYTMICTDDFSYTGILKAMENRDFYASTGIEFSEVSLCDGRLHAAFTECTHVMAYFGGRRWEEKSCPQGMTEADFAIPEGARYARVFCVDTRCGSMATTKPYPLG